MRLRIALAVTLLAATPALALEAGVYKGTIGKIPIILEMAESDLTPDFLGRYAYLSKGGDIPLHGTDKNGTLTLEEEAPCTEKLCKTADGENVDKAPIGATWTLKAKDGGKQLTGKWTDKKTGKTLPLTLERVGQRTLPEGYEGFDTIDPTFVPSGDVNALPSESTLPFDFLKMQFPLKEGKVETLGDSRFRLDTDSRTGLAYPSLVTLPGGDIAKANDYLARQRMRFSLDAFSCMAKSYLGLGWWGQESGMTTGYEDGATVEVKLLTPRLVGITESASFYCGGAHPYNFSNYRLGDIEKGEQIEPEKLLKGWIARDPDGKVVDPATVADKDTLTYGPDDTLLAFVSQHRTKPEPDYDAECPVGDLITTNFGVYFTQTEMVFTLKDLPNVIFACTTDLARVPLKDARPLLNDEGARLVLGG
jgi:hypothetical protein